MHHIADALSRAPYFPSDSTLEVDICAAIDTADPALSLIFENTNEDALCLDGEILLHGSRLVIPRPARSTIISRLHQSHSGMTKTCTLARQLYSWLGMTNKIQIAIAKCPVCVELLPSHSSEPLKQAMASFPMEHVSTDLFEVDRIHFLLLVDCSNISVEICLLFVPLHLPTQAPSNSLMHDNPLVTPRPVVLAVCILSLFLRGMPFFISLQLTRIGRSVVRFCGFFPKALNFGSFILDFPIKQVFYAKYSIIRARDSTAKKALFPSYRPTLPASRSNNVVAQAFHGSPLTSPPVLGMFQLGADTILQMDASKLKGLVFALLQLHDGAWRLLQCGSV
eukprot:TCALIF_08749-PA protein Name:"Protein of unknown function" AED:0.20 eAED:0.49 QI:8/0/0/1/0/0/5/0/336